MVSKALWGRVAALLLAGVVGAGAMAQERRPDPAPVGDEVVRQMLRQRSAAPDTLPQVLQQRLDESAAVLRDLEGRERDDAPSRRMRVAAAAQQVAALRGEARLRLREVRERMAAAGQSDKLAEWDALSARVDERFERVRSALESVRGAEGAQSREKARQALAELRVLHDEGAAARDKTEMPVLKPNWRSQKAQPRSELRRAVEQPRYLSVREEAPFYVFRGNALLGAAAAPPLPLNPPSCGTPSELAAAMAETQDVRITPEIRALAEQLGYSPARILRHVYERIAFEPYYGSLKGSVGTLVAGAGGATDQASLLIALLRASNIPARYVKAQVRVTDPTPAALGGRVARWVGAKSYAGAAAMLGQGQNPSVITINNASAQAVGVSFTHVYAEACVPYGHYRGMQHATAGARWIPLDASFKDASYQAGIVLGVPFDYDGFLSRRTHLLPDEYFAQQVQQAVRAAQPGATTADVPYKGRTSPLLIDVLPVSTPFEVDSFLAWDGGSSPVVAELPDSHRLKLDVAFSAANGTPLLSQTLSLPQTALNRLTLSFRGATSGDQSLLSAWQNDGSLSTPLPCTVNVVPVLRGGQGGAEGVELATGPTASPLGLCSADNQLTMNVRMDELVNPVLNGVSYQNIYAANYHALQAYAFQASDRLLGERAAGLLESVRAIGSPNGALDATEGEFLHLVGLKYMRYISDSSRRIGQLDGGSGDVGNHLGLTASQMKVMYLFDVPYAVARTGFLIDVPGGRSRSVDLTTGDLVWKTFLLAGYSSSAFEYYVWQENVRMDAVSTTRGMQFASEAGIPLLVANSANWTTVAATIATNPGCSLSNTNLNYPQCWLDSIKSNYIDQGFTVTLPRSLIHYGNWRGSVYVTALDNTASTSGLESVAGFIINGYSGGYTVQPGSAPLTTYDPGAGSGYTTPDPSVAKPKNSAGLDNGFDPRHTVLDGDLNVGTGSVFRSERDLSAAGRGGMPFVLERSYNSRDPQPGPFGFGWTHNFHQSIGFRDDNANGSTDAADTDGLTSTAGWTDGTGGEKRFLVTGTASGVAIGASFIRTPGTYAVMSREADGRYAVREKDGTTLRFESIAGTSGQRARLVSVTDRNNNVLTLTYAAACGNNLCSVQDALGRALSFQYDGNNRITRVTDWSGRQHGYAYGDGNGNLTAYSNPRALAGAQPPATYSYFGATDGPNLNHLLKEAKRPRGNGLRYEYYATGKLFRRTDALGYTRTYSYNDFRRETTQINERGETRSYQFDRYGNAIKLFEENGAAYEYAYDTAVPDNVHNRVSRTDPLGHLTHYQYDAVGNVTRVTHPSGNATVYGAFNAFGQPGRLKDPNGNYAILKYDSRGNRTQEIRLSRSYCTSHDCSVLDPVAYTPAAGDMVAWRVRGFDAFGNLSSIKWVRDFAAQVASPTATSTTGPITSTAYDTNGLYAVSVSRTGRKNAETTPSTQTAPVSHDTLGRTRSTIDADWHPRQIDYDELDRVTVASDGLGQLRRFDYDDNGNTVGQRLVVGGRMVDSNSATFDLNDRRVRSVDAGGNVSTLAYDGSGNVVLQVTPDNYAYGFEYDPLDRLLRNVDPEDNATVRTLDALGRPKTITDPNGNAKTFSYHGAASDGLLQSVADASNRRQSFVYDANGNPRLVTVVSTDGTQSRVTLTDYDEMDRPVRVVGPQVDDPVLGTHRPVTRYTYDTLGHLTAVAAGHTTALAGDNPAADVVATQLTRTYDDFSRKTREADALGRAWVVAYDANNNPSTVTDPASQTRQYGWGHGHQLMSLQDHAGAQTTYQRNALGQVTQVQSPEVTYDITYNASHRVESVRDSRAGKTLRYAYSPGGLLNSVTDSDGNRTDHDYDAVGRLAGLWAPNQDYLSFAYDRGGRLLQKWGVTTAGAVIGSVYTYRADDRLLSVANRAGGVAISSHTYGYDGFGNRNASADTIGGTSVTRTYVHDALNRLIEAGGSAAPIERYGYDPLGNRTSLQVGSGTPTVFRHDVANQLTELRSGSLAGPLLATLGYDANGNLRTRSDTGAVYNYDVLNRLATATVGGQSASYGYDDQGRRIRKVENGVTTNFVYDGPDIAAEYGAGWGTPQVQFVHGMAIDNPLVRIAASGSRYLHQDGINSVVALSTATGSLDATQRFDAWGQLQASTGSLPRYGFTGREPDASGLVHYRARYYDPALGRFTQRDPIGLAGGLNAYAYADNRPSTLTDPSGNCPMCVGAAASVVLGGLIRYIGSGGDWNAVMDPRAIAIDAAIGAIGTGLAGKGMQLYQEFRAGTGIERSRYLGQIGESSVGISQEGKTAIDVAGRTRFPDRLTPSGITEVKNVATISARDAKQILDDVAYAAGREGFDVTVLTREITDVSRIQRLIDSGAITHDILKNIAENGFRILSTGESASIGAALGSLRNLIEAIRNSGSGGYTVGDLPGSP